MYHSVLDIIFSTINVIGTLYAVLSILKIDVKTLFRSITLEGMDERDEELLLQREQARAGITLIAYGWSGQCYVSLMGDITRTQFWSCITVFLFIAFLLLPMLHKFNLKFKEDYKEYKKSRPLDTHKEDHEIKEF